MVDSNEDIDEHVEKAVQEILTERETGEFSVVAQIVREHRVSRYHVQRRLKGVGPRTSRKPTNYKLSETQEQALLRYILSLDEIGHSIRYDYVSKIANEMFKEDHTKNNPTSVVGHCWVQRFLNRHPELYKAKQKSLELKRKFAHDLDMI